MKKIILHFYSTNSKMRNMILPKTKKIACYALGCLTLSLAPIAIYAKKIDGAKVYQEECAACHDKGATGADGAPKIGDKAYWKPIFSKGIDKVFSFITSPKSHHPSCKKCSHSEIKAAITYIADKSDGANRTLW